MFLYTYPQEKKNSGLSTLTALITCVNSISILHLRLAKFHRAALTQPELCVYVYHSEPFLCLKARHCRWMRGRFALNNVSLKLYVYYSWHRYQMLYAVLNCQNGLYFYLKNLYNGWIPVEFLVLFSCNIRLKGFVFLRRFLNLDSCCLKAQNRNVHFVHFGLQHSINLATNKILEGLKVWSS